MKVKCVKRYVHSNITVDRIYEVLDDRNGLIFIRNDEDYGRWYQRSDFEDISQEGQADTV